MITSEMFIHHYLLIPSSIIHIITNHNKCFNSSSHSYSNQNTIQMAEKKEAFKKIFKSSLNASYFNTFQKNQFTQKSKIQIQKITQEQQVDEDTFRIIRGFQRPDDSYSVYEKKGFFHNEPEGFFACFSARKRLQVQLKNFKLTVRDRETVRAAFNFETEGGTVTAKGGYFSLGIESSDEQFYFEPVQQGKKNQVVDDWVGLIGKVITSSDGKKHHFNYLPAKNPQFYTQLHISNDEFMKSANSLDIVLFRSPHSAAAVQRLFTNSEYDHVGVVLRNKKNQIFIFESTSNEGVGLTSWKDMVRFEWHKSTDKIAWRKLSLALTAADANHIEAFVAKHLGKEFEITLDKLFMFSSTLKKSPEEEKQSFFCSELAARLYKELGLLDEKKSSTSYYPVDFSEKGGLKLLRQAYLGPQQVIAFNPSI